MKNLYTSLALVALMLFSFTVPQKTYGAVDEVEMKEKLPLMMGQSNVGKEYWFTIPPCYEDESAGHDNFVKVLIASPSATKVTVEVPGKGYYKTQTTIPNGVIDFKLTPTMAQAILHSGRQDKVREAQVYKGAGVHITADEPIVVYVMVRYYYTSDGFLAIPVNAFGNKYINMVFKEPALWANGWFNPFTGVTAAYDDTEVTFTMGGGDEGNDGVPLLGGRVLRTGQSTKEYLDKGDVWLLSINGQRQDLSGSLFQGNKPFSIVSGVHCANFPLGVYACDYTVEMELPTYTWGKQYFVTPMKKRTYNGIIRIFASEDNTNVYRNGSYVGTIKKGGGADMGVGYLEMRVWPQLDDFSQPIGPKIATFTSDKPISIMYYNTGTSEDVQRVNTDPFMMIFSPIEQFNTEMYFASPNATGGADPFPENYIILVFELHDDFMPPDLQFAEMSTTGRDPEWIEVSQRFGGGYETFTETYKGKKYGTATYTLPTEGVYGIKSDSTKFVAYSYGFSNYDSYGFPTAAALKDLSTPDTNTPIPAYVQTCDGDVLKDMGTVTDMPDDDDVRSNMADIYLIENLNDNYDFKWRSKTGEFIPGQQRTLSWWLTVIDKKQAAKAVIYFTDRAGNDTTITVEYNPPEYEVVSGNKFGVVNETAGPVFMQDTIRNLSASVPLYVTRVELQKGDQGFSIDSYEPNTWSPGMEIGIGEEVIVNIKFDPSVAKPLAQPVYIDSLGIGYGDETFAECGFFYETEQEAFLGSPTIEVSDWDFGQRNINEANPDQRTIYIENNGSKDLEVYGISQDLVDPVFTHDFNTKFPNISQAQPLIVKPGEAESFIAYFKPTAELVYADNIVFESNANETTDNVCELKGEGISSAVSLFGYKWEKHLIDRVAFPAGPYLVDGASAHQGFKVQNLGDKGVLVRAVRITVVNETPNAREYFRVGNQNIVEYLNAAVLNANLGDGQSIEGIVEFLPTATGDHSIELEFEFNQQIGSPVQTIKYEGTGLVPHIEVDNVTYGSMLIDDEANALTTEVMTITNTQNEYGYPLTITALNPVLAADVSNDMTDFQGRTFKYDDTDWQTAISTPLPVGASITVPVHFVARVNGENRVDVEIASNADQTDSYDPNSEWIGEGFAVGIRILPVQDEICLKDAPVTYDVVIENTTPTPVDIIEIKPLIEDVDNNGTNDLTIITPTTNLTIPGVGSITVRFSFNPEVKVNPRDIGLDITHSYGNNLSIEGAGTALNLGVIDPTGNTTSNINGASSVDRTVSTPYAAQYMVSIGDEFGYEIGFEGDARDADVTELTVNVNYNRYFLSPQFDVNDVSGITFGKANMQVRPGSLSIVADAMNPKEGSMQVSFVVESTDGQPILTTNGQLASLPFLVVLPADSDVFNPQDILAEKDLGLFDMSHEITGITGCYNNEEDQILVGVTEICTGTLRLLYIGDLTGQLAKVAPNPVSGNGGTIEYSVPFDQQGEIAIYNSVMQKVATIYDGQMKEGRQSVDVPVSELSNGSYYFKITMGQKEELGRLIIQK